MSINNDVVSDTQALTNDAHLVHWRQIRIRVALGSVECRYDIKARP